MSEVLNCPCGTSHDSGERFYVTVVDAGKVGLLAGPFGNHPAALHHVEPARELAEKANPFAHFYSFGTMGVKPGNELPAGLFNAPLNVDALP